MTTALTFDEAAGMAWWNNSTEAERTHWLSRSGYGSVADAWGVFKRAHPDYGTPNWCPTCSPKNIGYCRCDPASNN